MIIFRALSVNDRQKHIKMYEISNKTALLLKHNEKAEKAKISCFLLAEMK